MQATRSSGSTPSGLEEMRRQIPATMVSTPCGEIVSELAFVRFTWLFHKQRPRWSQLRHYRFSTRCLKDTWPLALVASAEKRMPGTNAQATCAQQLELEPRVSKKSERTETPADNSGRSCTCEPHLAYPSLEPSDTKDAEASQRHPGREHTCP